MYKFWFQEEGCGGVFRTQKNIYNGTIFAKKLHVHVWLGSKYAPGMDKKSLKLDGHVNVQPYLSRYIPRESFWYM